MLPSHGGSTAHRIRTKFDRTVTSLTESPTPNFKSINIKLYLWRRVEFSCFSTTTVDAINTAKPCDERVTWWAMWRRSDGRLCHKTGAEWEKDLFVILRREVREGRLQKKTEYNDVKGMKEEGGRKRLTSFERFVGNSTARVRTLYSILSFILNQCKLTLLFITPKPCLHLWTQSNHCFVRQVCDEDWTVWQGWSHHDRMMSLAQHL